VSAVPPLEKTARIEWQMMLLVAGITAVALVMTVAIAAISASGVADRRRMQLGVVRSAAREVIRQALEAETGERGFLLTGSTIVLEPYRVGMASLEPALVTLDRALAGRHADELAELIALMSEIRTELSTGVARYQPGQLADAGTVALTEQTHHKMQRARTIVDDLVATETVAFEAARTRQQRLRDFAAMVILVGCSVTAIALVVGLIAQRRRTSERIHAFEVVTRQINQLEEQSREMTRGVRALAAANDALATTNEALSRSNRDLDQFAYVASHDLKAPLRGISSLTTWIEDDLRGAVSEAVREHLRLLRNRVVRMESLINGVLAYARAGKQRGPVSAVDVRQLVVETKALLEVPSAIRIAIAGTAWPTLQTEAAPMQQVWLNLLSNAVKHGVPRGGTIEAGCDLVDGEPRYWVKDDGRGIAPIYHDRIFEIFQRLASRDEDEGAGIGLSVVRKLVEAEGGRVWIESAEGQGTTMFFTWGHGAGAVT